MACSVTTTSNVQCPGACRHEIRIYCEGPAETDVAMCGGVVRFLGAATHLTKTNKATGRKYGHDDVPGLVDFLSANREERGATIWCPSKRCFPTEVVDVGHCSAYSAGGKTFLSLLITRHWICKYRRTGGGYDEGDDRDPDGGGTASASVTVKKPTCPGTDGKIEITVTISGARDAAAALANATAAAQDAYKNHVSGQGKLCDGECTGVWGDGTPFAADPPSLPDVKPATDVDKDGNGTYKWAFTFSCVKAEGLKYTRKWPDGPGASDGVRLWRSPSDTVGMGGAYRVALAAYLARQSGAPVDAVVHELRS